MPIIAGALPLVIDALDYAEPTEGMAFIMAIRLREPHAPSSSCMAGGDRIRVGGARDASRTAHAQSNCPADVRAVPSLHASGSLVTLGSYVLAGVAIAVAVAMLGDELGRHIHAFESWGAGLGPGALLVFVLLYVVLDSVFVPDTLLGIIAGATFGFVEGFTVVAAGSIIAGLLQFAMSRRLLKPFIERKIATRPALSAMREAVLREQLKLQLLIRLTPINRALTSYVLGASGVRFSRFALAGIALVPHIALEVYFGFAGKNLARAASVPENIDRAQDVALALGLVVTFAVLALVSRIARKAVAGAIGEAQPTSTAQ